VATQVAPAQAAVLSAVSVAQRISLHNPPELLITGTASAVREENLGAIEQWRVLRARLVQAFKAKRVRTLLVTSAQQSEGKTVTSANLAFAMAQLRDRKILLVDADLRKPTLSDFLGIHPECGGLDEFLTKPRRLSEVTVELQENLHAVLSRSLPNSAELLHGSRMQAFLQEAGAYDLVIFDSPPLLVTADAQILAQMTDASLMVVRANQTPFDKASQAAAMLGSRALGSILNGAAQVPNESYYYRAPKPRKFPWSRS
jgi:capsular exopolysaccharide synthesis family protein